MKEDNFMIPFQASFLSRQFQFNDCPHCHGGNLTFAHDDKSLVSESYRILCNHCGYLATGGTWREALENWNRAVKSDVPTITIDLNEGVN